AEMIAAEVEPGFHEMTPLRKTGGVQKPPARIDLKIVLRVAGVVECNEGPAAPVDRWKPIRGHSFNAKILGAIDISVDTDIRIGHAVVIHREIIEYSRSYGPVVREPGQLRFDALPPCLGERAALGVARIPHTALIE